MKLLAIDTSSDACSVAISLDYEVIEKFELTPRKHIEALQPMVDAVLKESGLQLSDLTGLAFGCGPGSFSGLRIACSFIQGLSAALNLPVAAVSTLGAMASHYLETHPDTLVLSALDARMNEVYAGLYYLNEQGNVCALIPDCVIDPLQFGFAEINQSMIQNKLTTHSCIGVGNAWGLAHCQPVWQDRFNPQEIMLDSVARAGDIVVLAQKDFIAGHVLSFDQIQPVYLRHNVALNLAGQAALRAANLANKV